MKILLLVCCIVMIGFGVSLGATIESVTVYEITGDTNTFTFQVDSSSLATAFPYRGFPIYQWYDFTAWYGATEVYDIYISDSNATLNKNGMYLTIDCIRPEYYTGIHAAHNIDAVSLNYDNGNHVWANVFTEYYLGYNQLLGDANLGAILGPPDGNPTYVGDQFSSITVGFGLTQPINPVPEPSLMVLLGISMASIAGLKRWWKE